MIDLNIKNEEEKVIAEYLLKTNDRIDNLTLGMMVNNDIEGVIPIQPVQIDSDRYFRYDITGKVTMKKYLGDFVKKDKILRTFYGIAETIKESTEYMINWTSFSLDKNEIFIDEETGKVSLICLPLLTVINDGNTCNFFKNILFGSQFDLDENGDYVGKLITFLNPKTYTLDKFIYELEEMLELEHKIVEEEEEIEEEEVSTVNSDSEDTEKILDDDSETLEEDIHEESKTDGPLEDENISEEKNEDKSNDVEEIETIAEAEEVEEYVEDKEKAEQSSEEIIRPETKPYLVKISNNQKIDIDKDTFYIGKDEKDVDYCIAGNSAIDEKHAYIIRHGKEYFVVDNNSKNHTYLNRVLIGADEETFIPHGAQLRFADEDFEFRMHK